MSRIIANWSIHVEYVIGCVRQKYTVLGSTLQIDYLVIKETDMTMVDKMCHICCALTNCCEFWLRIISFDWYFPLVSARTQFFKEHSCVDILYKYHKWKLNIYNNFNVLFIFKNRQSIVCNCKTWPVLSTCSVSAANCLWSYKTWHGMFTYLLYHMNW